MLNKNKHGAKKHFANWLIFGLILLTLLNSACESPSLKKKDRAASTPENKQTAFEQDLQTMKTADFEYVFVFRRKDGGAFDGEDRKYLRANSPPATNRFISTDDDKAFIAGSKYKFSPENLEILRQRFNIEDYSELNETKPEEKTNANS
jgi:hypothetical protein